jgi:hypothetical protein
MTTTESKKPIVKLVGNDGNAFSIMGACIKAAKKAGWPQSDIDMLKAEMTSGDYDNLLATACRHFDIK